MSALNVGATLAVVWCACALATQYVRAKRSGLRKLFSPPAGDANAGVRYAFTKGMAPQAKESVRMNPYSYMAGMLYHAGILAALILLGAKLAGFGPSKLLGVLALLGTLGGLLLLGKRIIKNQLRRLSCPDDFVSNALATTFSALAGAGVFVPTLAPIWFLGGMALLAYAPLGKIRHCVFFFSTRYHFGAFFGRRGVFPPSQGGA